MVSDVSSVSPRDDDDCLGGDRRQADGENKKKQRRNTTIMHVHVGRKKRHAVQPSVRCCLPANGTSPKYSSTLSVDMLLSDRDTLDNDPLLASREPPAGNCNKSSSVSVSMSRDRRLYTCQQVTPTYMHFSSPLCPPHFPRSTLKNPSSDTRYSPFRQFRLIMNKPENRCTYSGSSSSWIIIISWLSTETFECI